MVFAYFGIIRDFLLSIYTLYPINSGAPTFKKDSVLIEPGIYADAIVQGLSILAYDHVTMTYVSTTNNLDTVIYRRGGATGTVVATVTYTYVGGTPTTNNARIATITKTPAS